MTSPGIDKFNPLIKREGPVDLLPFIPQSAQRVLDSACGDGALARLLKQRGPVEVTGISSEPETAHDADSLDRVIVSDLREPKLPFSDGYFDCIVNDGGLPAYRVPEAVLPEFTRMLAPGGLMVFTVPNMHFYKAVASLAQGRWQYGGEGILARKNLRYYTGHEIKRLFENVGFLRHWRLPLVTLPPETLPRDASGHISYERVSIGPLTDDEYTSLRTETYLVLALKPGA